MLCELCRAIFTSERVPVEDLWSGPFAWQPHHPTPASLCTSATAGCYVCRRLWAHFTADGRMDLSVRIKDENLLGYCLSNLQDRQYLPHPEDALFLKIRFNKGLTCTMAASDSTAYGDISTTSLFVIEPRQDPEQPKTSAGQSSCLETLDLEQQGDSVARTTDAPSCWRLAEQWIDQCVHHHDKCCYPDRDPTWLPTRVLDVGVKATDQVHLLITTTGVAQGPYLTLSHC